MESQLELDGATVILSKEQPHGEPALYGEEQLHSKAIIRNMEMNMRPQHLCGTTVPNRPSSVASTMPPKRQQQSIAIFCSSAT
mmetsp:Transcript_29011/g.52487  ORF Transcript_29011/g.52487 Transcript_29011/m.52487 type:complete len:83 (+) Transcript_29011:269-517(+)